MMITRRELMMAAVPVPLVFAQMSRPGWFDRPMRWAQVAFTEDDPGNYDLGMWLRYFKKIHADAACLDRKSVV